MAAPLIAISSISCQVMSRSDAPARSAAISRIRGSQASYSFLSTSPTIVGFEVAPTAPLPTAYSSSAIEHESFQYSVGVVRAISPSGVSIQIPSRRRYSRLARWPAATDSGVSEERRAWSCSMTSQPA